MGKIAEAENVRLITTDRYRNKQPAKWTEMPIFPLLKPIVMYLIPDDFSPERLKKKPSNRSVIRSIKSDCSGKMEIFRLWDRFHSLATGEPMCTKRFIPSPKIRDYYVCCSNK